MYQFTLQAALFVQCGQGGLFVSGVTKMKRSLPLAFGILVKLGSCLAACIGCSSKNPPEQEPSRVIRWKGQNTGYENTTAVPPTYKAGSTGQKKFQ